MNAETLDQILYWTTTVLTVFAVIWLVLWIYKSIRAKSLNLTDMQTVDDASARPDFLKVDHAKRDAALKAAEVFDRHVAQRDAPPVDKAVNKYCLLAKAVTIVFAIASLATGVIGAVTRVKEYDEAVKKYGIWDNFVELVNAYPVGFVVAVVVICIVGFNFYRSLRAE